MRLENERNVPEALRLRIYEVVKEVPAGRVATYGDVATVVGGGCDARTVGYALNMVPKTSDDPVPWQRIINAQGGISTSGVLQRKLLENEGIGFDGDGRVPLKNFRWAGPSPEWAARRGFNVLPPSAPPDAEQLALF